MLYPVYVWTGDEQHAHGLTFPDFPGCHSAADDSQDIPRMAQEALECHLFGETSPLPAPTPLEQLAHHPDYQHGVWMLIEIDLSRIDARPKRVNVTLPRSLLAQIDAWANRHGQTRSAFLAEAAKAAMHD